MALIETILNKLFLGVTLAAPIGPVNLEMIRRGLNSGFLAAFMVRVGGCVGQSAYLALAHLSLSAVKDNPALANIAGLLGSFFLLYLGYVTCRKRISHIDDQITDEQFTLGGGLMTGIIMAIANPVSIVWWIAFVAAASTSVDSSLSTLAALGLDSFIIIGVLIFGLAFSFLLDFGRRHLTPQLINIITVISGLCLVYFGLKYGYTAVQNLIDLFGS